MKGVLKFCSFRKLGDILKNVQNAQKHSARNARVERSKGGFCNQIFKLARLILFWKISKMAAKLSQINAADRV